jgi:hypothetical protein
MKIVDDDGNEIPFDTPCYRIKQVCFIMLCSFLSGAFFAVWLVKYS